MFTRWRIMFAVAAGLLLAVPLTGTAAAATTAKPTEVIVGTIHANGVQPFSGTGCTHGTFGNPLVCIYVNGTGLIVNYATVTNDDAPTGQAIISQTYNNTTYYGPFNFGHGKAWRKDLNLHMHNQNKVCGSVSGLDVACLVIHT